MGVQVGLCESKFLPPGLHVPPNVAAALTADGWTPPETKESETDA